MPSSFLFMEFMEFPKYSIMEFPKYNKDGKKILGLEEKKEITFI